MPRVVITGADKITLVGKAVRKMGSDRTIVKNLAKKVKRLATPVRSELRASAVARLPRRGGLNLWVAKSQVTLSVKRGSNTAGVTLREGRNSEKGRSDLRKMDRGKLRHPVWGNRRKWSLQSIEPSFFTDVIEGPVTRQFAGQVDEAVDEAIAEVLHAIG